MGGRAAEEIRDAIRDHGPITFAEFMDRALYGPGGFFEGTPVGTRGDFVTSPHVHPVFGELLGKGIRELHALLGRPKPLRIAEVGAGDGTLARQLIGALGGLELDYRAVEIGKGALDALTGIEPVRPDRELSAPVDLIVANELLDNLPFRLIRSGREVRISLEDDAFTEVLVAPDDELAPQAAEPGEQVVPVGALAFVDLLATTMTRGYALLIDYGGVGTTGGPIHGYRDHRVVDDVVTDPGTTDITSGVDFERIATHAQACGLTAHQSITQRDALLALGFEDWFRAELTRQHDLLEARVGLEAVRVWSGRSRASILIDPAALGRLRWLVLATPGLPAPGWLGADQ